MKGAGGSEGDASRPDNLKTMLTKEQRSERHRAGRLKGLERKVARLVFSLTPGQMAHYRRWLLACDRLGVAVTADSRLEFLSDLVEMKEAA